MRTPPARVVATLLALAPATLGFPALAQPPAEETTSTAMARSRFREGVEFFDKGQYEQARASFLQAYALKKHPAVLLNLAWSCLKGGHTLEAERYFKQFQAESKEATEKQRTDAAEGLAQARAKLGRIEISAPAGTEATIDGERVGTTPIADQISVEAGAHTIKFRGSDGATETESVNVLGGEKVVARATHISVPAAPPPAVVPPPPSEAVPPLVPTPAPKAVESAPGNNPGPMPEAPPETSQGSHPLWGPLVASGIVTVAGVATAVIAGVYFKNQAQDSANQSYQNIVTAANMRGITDHRGLCNSPPSVSFQHACARYADNNNQVDQDATIGNIGVVVAIAGAVGTLVFSLIRVRDDDGSAAPPTPVVSPVVGPSYGGLTLAGKF
jgi:Tfp pilus assembly protein PilF